MGSKMVKKEIKEDPKKVTKKEVKTVAEADKIKKEDKKVIVADEKIEKVKAKKTQKKAVDTGSVDFQVKNFSDKIQLLSSHLKKHPHDFDSRRGLLIMVGKRRRLLNYFKKKDVEMYEKLAASLKLKK